MDCMECNKRPATLYFTQLVNGKLIEIKICEHCANKYNLHQGNQASFHDLLNEFFNVHQLPLSRKTQNISQEEAICCNHCQLTWKAFRMKGKFGCEHCYVQFGTYLPNLLRRVHNGNIKHTGKIPKKHVKAIENNKLIGELKKELKQCIEEENFERAAIIRDQIYNVEKHAGQKDGDS